MEESERQKAKTGEERKEVDKVQLPPAVSTSVAPVDGTYESLVIARRKFNIYFATFWHLTHLASVNTDDRNIKASWTVVKTASHEWRKLLDNTVFHKFDNKLTISLDFMEDKISSRSSVNFEEKSIAILENFDKCLDLATEFTDQVHNDKVDVTDVCARLLDGFVSALKNFKMLPLLWNHLFVFHTYQLLLLAKDCCRASYEYGTLAFWSNRHADCTAELGEHFSNQSTSWSTLASSTASTNLAHLASSKLFSPTVPLDALITTLSAEAKCAAKQIPVAVTAIVHEYCHIHPFSPNDFKFINKI